MPAQADSREASFLLQAIHRQPRQAAPVQWEPVSTRLTPRLARCRRPVGAAFEASSRIIATDCLGQSQSAESVGGWLFDQGDVGRFLFLSALVLDRYRLSDLVAG